MELHPIEKTEYERIYNKIKHPDYTQWKVELVLWECYSIKPKIASEVNCFFASSTRESKQTDL